MHDIYRDALAVEIKGITEPRVDDELKDRSDVLVLSDKKLIEVKILSGSGSQQIKSAIGQLMLDSLRLNRSGIFIDKLRCHFVIESCDASLRRSQMKQVARLRSDCGQAYEISTIDKKKFPDNYRIGGVDIPRDDLGIKGKVLNHFYAVSLDFLFAEHLAKQHQDFLFALADRYLRLNHSCRAYSVRGEKVNVYGNEGVSVFCDSAKGEKRLPIIDAIDSWLRLEHHAWVYGG